MREALFSTVRDRYYYADCLCAALRCAALAALRRRDS